MELAEERGDEVPVPDVGTGGVCELASPGREGLLATLHC